MFEPVFARGLGGERGFELYRSTLLKKHGFLPVYEMKVHSLSLSRESTYSPSWKE